MCVLPQTRPAPPLHTPTPQSNLNIELLAALEEDISSTIDVSIDNRPTSQIGTSEDLVTAQIVLYGPTYRASLGGVLLSAQVHIHPWELLGLEDEVLPERIVRPL